MIVQDLDLSKLAEGRGWKIAPMWSIARRVDRKGYPDAELLSVYRDYGVIRKSDRDDNHNVESEDLSVYKYVKAGDLVLNKMKTWQGSLGVSAYDGIVSPAYFTCELSTTVYGPYIHYLLRSQPYIAMYGALSKGIRVNQWDLPYEEFRSIPVLLPQLEEQRRIADYLDEQSARFDEILQAKRRYIEKIRELYLRSIGKITSGLDSTSNSLLPDWQVQRISWNFKTGSGTTPTSSSNQFFDGTIPWVNSGDLNDGLVTESSKCVTELAIQTFSALKVYQPGALLVAMYGATVGKTALLGVSACVNQAVCVLEPTGEVLPEYARYWFFANRSALMDQSVGGGQPNINQDILRSQRIPFPDKETQEILITQLNDETQKHLEMTLLVERSIDQIIDFKTSLITAAVTGTFDVTSGRSVA